MEFVAMLKGHNQSPADATKITITTTTTEVESRQDGHITRPRIGKSASSSTKTSSLLTAASVELGKGKPTSLPKSNICTPTKTQTSEKKIPSHSPALALNSAVSSSVASPKNYSVSGPRENLVQSRETTQNRAVMHSHRDPLMSETAAVKDSADEATMEVETEKEDITATLALLNSMASELDNVLDG